MTQTQLRNAVQAVWLAATIGEPRTVDQVVYHAHRGYGSGMDPPVKQDDAEAVLDMTLREIVEAMVDNSGKAAKG